MLHQGKTLQLLRGPLRQRFSTDAARAVIANRSAVKSFKPDAVPDAVLADILRLTQRAPTGFNTQPYAVVLVRDQADRNKLADAMLASNSRKVQEAPVVAVFAADLEPSSRVPRLQQMLHENGAPADFVQNLPHFVRLFSGEGQLATGVQSIISTLMSPLRAVPAPVPTVAWSFKQTSFAAATFLYAAQAHGLATCPMEGFDDVRLRTALDIPDRYVVPVVVALGFPKDTAGTPPKQSPRLPPSEIFFDGKFGQSSEALFKDSQ